MWKNIILILALSNVVNGEYRQSDGPCKSAFETDGICSVLHECDEIFSMLKASTRAFLPTIHDILRETNCGFDGFRPKICCPQRPIAQNTITSSTSENNAPLPPDVTRHPNLNQLPVLCGNGDADRITVGERTSVTEYPWMALIAYNSKRGVSFVCGGSMINSRFILTAAHCVTDLKKVVLAGVRVGEHNTATERDCEGLFNDTHCASAHQDFLIESVFVHPQYNVPRLQNDIALIKLDRPIDSSKNNVYPICLPLSEELRNMKLEGLMMIIAGWGQTENNTFSNVLLQTQIQVRANSQCDEAFKPYLSTGSIGHKQICAEGENGADFCRGDSGGPLMFSSNVNGVIKVVQHGIISYGARICGTVGKPGVYTRVAYYMDWILDQLQK